ncbi:MAG: stress response translation initiation inhibitor YciH [Planctomycetaceae bacterium]|nr:stress response translation initiation inhibitor YciH [Planctomycetaceae bacterium]
MSPPPPPPAQAKKIHTVKVGRETAGRKGKGVTVVSDLPLGEEALKELATKLKNSCGSGGTAKDGRIEIQGDHRDKLVTELEKLGYKVKRSGG